jgi:hypothetical protein
MKSVIGRSARWKLWLLWVLCLLSVPSPAHADNCGSLSDCYAQILVAILVALAIALLILLLLELAAAAAAARAAAASVDIAAIAEQALAATTAVHNGGKLIQATRIVSAMSGLTAAQKVDVVLEIIRRLGFGIDPSGVVNHGRYLEIISDSGRQAFRFIIGTTRIWYGKFDMIKGEFIWELLL